jgi:hypothetical protein
MKNIRDMVNLIENLESDKKGLALNLNIDLNHLQTQNESDDLKKVKELMDILMNAAENAVGEEVSVWATIWQNGQRVKGSPWVNS